MTQNLGTLHPEDAWHAMAKTWRDRTRLKREAGVDLRGRDNAAPVLHYTLSWAQDETPSAQHMQETTLSSLAALKLGEHQAVIAAHRDKQHLHVHVVVNTVHPDTGRTAPLKYSKEQLSRWAEVYEKEHGIHCEERIKNNEERKRLADERAKEEATRTLAAASNGERLPEKAPFVPVKHKEVPRKQWFERREIVGRMKAMRATLDQEMKTARAVTWARQSKERDDLDNQSKAGIDRAREQAQDRYRPQWRELYRKQKKEERHVARIRDSLFERAVFVFQNRDRLRSETKPLTFRQMVGLATSGDRLERRVAHVHERERRSLARNQKTETKALTDAVWRRHRERFAALRDRQAGERQAERDIQTAERKSITFMHAKAALVTERENAPQPTRVPRAIKREPQLERAASSFEKAATPLPSQTAPWLPEKFQEAARPEPASQVRPSRADEIKRQMDEWRKRNGDRDFGREI